MAIMQLIEIIFFNRLTALLINNSYDTVLKSNLCIAMTGNTGSNNALEKKS